MSTSHYITACNSSTTIHCISLHLTSLSVYPNTTFHSIHVFCSVMVNLHLWINIEVFRPK